MGESFLGLEMVFRWEHQTGPRGLPGVPAQTREEGGGSGRVPGPREAAGAELQVP